ncbi:hypothetical protein [Polaribacter marinivivus]|uniref:hypothetical protein n=1 Tax=Polaribacter marinivivus TaxID=1524260 RepID=UPI003D333AFC
MNYRLRKDLNDFLDTYFKFVINEKYTNQDYLVLDGNVDVIDTKGNFWNDYFIRLLIPISNYPSVIPSVYEISEEIEREDDFHISKKGECCLDIHHKLILEKRRGINLIAFYKKYIYPFFANHQYKIKTNMYANGEYKHDVEGVVQFYNDEYNLSNSESIVKYIELALGVRKADRNKECIICGGRKYKNCCFLTVEKLKSFGSRILKTDLEIFKNKQNTQ